MKVYIINLLLPGLGVYLLFRFFPELPDTALANFALFISIYFVLWLISYFYNRIHFIKVKRFVSLFFFFVKELVVANLKIAYDVLTPKLFLTPGVIAYPLDARTDLEITILANLISLTPGTLSIDVSEDRKTLYFHALYISGGDTQAVVDEIKQGFERRLLELTR